MEKHGNRNIRRAQTMDGFNDDRCLISFFRIENFIAKIDTYQGHQMKRARQTDRSLESLGNYCESKYRKVASSNTFRLEAHAGFIRMLMKGIFYPYVL